ATAHAEDICKRLQQAAHDYHVLLLVLVQINRAAVENSQKRAQVRHLRSTSSGSRTPTGCPLSTAPVHTSPTHLPAATRCSGLPMPRSRWSHPAGKSGSCRFPLCGLAPTPPLRIGRPAGPSRAWTTTTVCGWRCSPGATPTIARGAPRPTHHQSTRTVRACLGTLY